ncbi:MAG: thiamine pyrophosphate-dependent enzyme [Flavobacteriaceae bacterium]|nr:thiamine pyrophosphate-dependent enzyme [Flavobacteriaceae bacterium]
MAEFVSNPELVKEENLVYKRTGLLTPKALSYCPGCGHGTAHRVIMEVLEEMDIQSETIGVAPVGCSVLAYDFMDIDIQQAAHGRAPAVATAIKRLFPEKYVFTYQGDGDLAAIGTGETIHACNRGENITIIFVNNGIYGMTGGQMAPTTLPGMRSSTSPFGRDIHTMGNPLKMTELVAQLPGTLYVTRSGCSYTGSGS